MARVGCRFPVELVPAHSSSTPDLDDDHLPELAFACKTSQLRREWILYLKSRLKSEQYVESLRRLYLQRLGDSR